MSETAALLELIKDVARKSSDSLRSVVGNDYEYDRRVPREMKAAIDGVLESIIVKGLAHTGMPVLSEESGAIPGEHMNGLRFVVDPLDGTVNYTRGLGPSAVSIALCRGNEPIAGAISVFPGGDLAWGGKTFGAYLNDQAISVSRIHDTEKSVLCTGFPARFRVAGDATSLDFTRRMNRYGKVRMLGAASVSLLQVAKGSAELYAENDIMLWDVAAGLAIVEGARGSVRIVPGSSADSFNVVASNGLVEHIEN